MGAYSFRPTLGVDEEGNFADLGLSEANHGLTQSVAEDFGALYAPAGLRSSGGRWRLHISPFNRLDHSGR